MKLTKAEKMAFAFRLKVSVNEAYAGEILNSNNEISYLGVCKITDMIEHEFVKKAGEFPKLIDGACRVARALRNPDKVKTQEDLRKGFALLVTTAGGLSIAWGLLSMLSLWTAFWVFVFGIHIPFLGPLAFFGGLATAVAGVYVAIARQTPEQLSAKAHDVLIEAISNWADEKAAKERDAAARKALLQNYSRAEAEGNQGSILWRTVTWPYRTAHDFVDTGPKATNEPSHKPPQTENDRED